MPLPLVLQSHSFKRLAQGAAVGAVATMIIGFSWGGYESLVLPADSVRTVSAVPAPNLVRLQIGLEDPDDLIADLAGAFAQAGC